MELSQVVKVDFSGFSKAAADSKDIEANLKNSTRALREMKALALPGNSGGGVGAFMGRGGNGGGNRGFGGTGNFYINRANIYVVNANVVFQNAKLAGFGGGLGGSATPKEKGGFSSAGLLATAAAADAFVWKAAALANPGAMERFNDAIADTTAVVGHKLIPALNELTRLIRDVGDWMANHPTATSAVAYGGLGLAGIATAGVGLNFARQIGSGLGWGYNGIRGLFGGGSGASGAAGGTRVVSSAEMASGRAIVSGEGSVAAAEGVGLLGKLGRVAGRLGPALAFLDPIITTYQGATTGQTSKFLEGQFSSRTFGGMVPSGNPGVDFLGQSFGLLKRIYTEEEFKEADRRIAKWNPFARGVDENGNPVKNTESDAAKAAMKSSWGAAARPTQYTDVLSSVLQMRQAISSSAGNDPNERTADASERTANATEELLRRTALPANDNGGGMNEARRRINETPRGG